MVQTAHLSNRTRARRAARLLAVSSAIGVALVLAGCQRREAESQPVILHTAMKTVVAPQAQVVWDISNHAMNANGDPDGSKITAADWVKLVSAGQALKTQAAALADAHKVVAASPGDKIQDEGTPRASGAAQVQGYLDADHATFSQHARALSAAGENIVAASNAHDAVKLADVANSLDQVCEACHLKFWYPDQAPPTK